MLWLWLLWFMEIKMDVLLAVTQLASREAKFVGLNFKLTFGEEQGLQNWLDCIKLNYQFYNNW